MSARSNISNVTRRQVVGMLSGAGASVLMPKTVLAQSNELGLGIIIIVASWCSVCHQAAPILKVFEEQNGIPVLMASMDGRPVSPYLTAEDARLHPVASKFQTVPTTLLYSAAANDVVGQIQGFRSARGYITQLKQMVLSAIELGGNNNV